MPIEHRHRRTRIQNSFGDDLYIPGIPDADLDFDAPDIGIFDVDDECEDYNIFDFDRTDNNTNSRYMRPRPTRIPQMCVRYDNADALARAITLTKGMRIDCFVDGSFIFGDFIEAFLRRNNCKATTMTISTLSMSEENVDSLNLLMKKGFIDNLNLLISDYFYAHERHTLIPYIYRRLDIGERFQIAVARIHTKTCHFKSLGGKKIVIHGSANLRANGNVEQFTIEEDPKLYDFYEKTLSVIFNEYQTINHSVKSRSSWSDFEKRLTDDNPKTK